MAKRDLFDFNFSIDLPNQDDFPINADVQDRTVKQILLRDIRASDEYLIITGFTSLSQLIEIFGAEDYPLLKKLRVVIGFDPDERVSKRLAHYSPPAEIKNYWARQNISIRLCGPIINLIQKITEKTYEFKVKDKLHAKLYIGRDAAILGSSNFSKSGTMKQAEANIRVQPKEEDNEKYQYESIKKIGEYYYNLAEDFNNDLITLLRKLLCEASWQEALARAIAEILESKWMKDYPVLYNALMSHELWPSQKIGIAKAMKIIQDQGRVLIADPTGSGKTKFATALAYTLFHWLWENGHKDRSAALIICPKQVMDNWDREQKPFKGYNTIASMGRLSQGTEKNIRQLQKEIEAKDILIVDEAHNYLSYSSLRSKAINPKSATHIILSTATPINKKAEDILRLIELLDLDNLNDEDLKKYKELRSNRNKKPNKHQLDDLKNYINQFIVRRTKKELNRMIEREPQRYLNRNNRACRYPKPITDTYKTGETENDKKLAEQIASLASELKGINYLKNWKIPPYHRNNDEKRQYISNRFKAAKALAAFVVRSTLRSSQCALIEYIHGTEYASELFSLGDVKKDATGKIIHRLEKRMEGFATVKFPLEFVTKETEWISDEAKYKEACDEEIRIYREIGVLASQLSGKREETKADELIKQVNKYGKVLAFDSRIITLEYIKLLVEKKVHDVNVIVATGSSEKNKALVKEYFGLQTTNKERMIALCSEAMSEGINLPDAKSLVLLDMPSVLRIIEQRIGRLERMDSEHDEIYIFWPDDSDAFSLKGDKRLVEILVMAEELIGTNVDIPQTIFDKHLKGANTTDEFISRYKSYEEQDEEWEGVKDSTQSLYSLFEGKDALIDQKTYELYADVDASVKTAISFIETERVFSFFAFRGDAARSPKWLFIDERNNAFTDFDEISKKLKDYLRNNTIISRTWKEVEAGHEIKKILLKLRRHEKKLLPPKKRRALEIGKRLLTELKSQIGLNDQRHILIDKLLALFDVDRIVDDWIDYNHFADLWLMLLLPVLDKLRSERTRKRKLITLIDIKLKHVDLDEGNLSRMLENCQYASTLDELIAACIIGLAQ